MGYGVLHFLIIAFSGVLFSYLKTTLIAGTEIQINIAVIVILIFCLSASLIWQYSLFRRQMDDINFDGNSLIFKNGQKKFVLPTVEIKAFNIVKPFILQKIFGPDVFLYFVTYQKESQLFSRSRSLGFRRSSDVCDLLRKLEKKFQFHILTIIYTEKRVAFLCAFNSRGNLAVQDLQESPAWSMQDDLRRICENRWAKVKVVMASSGVL